MEPLFIYFDELKCDDQKRFILNFSKKDKIKKLLFSKKKHYFITSMKWFIKLDEVITDWKEYRKNKKLSQMCKIIIDKGLM